MVTDIANCKTFEILFEILVSNRLELRDSTNYKIFEILHENFLAVSTPTSQVHKLQNCKKFVSEISARTQLKLNSLKSFPARLLRLQKSTKHPHDDSHPLNRHRAGAKSRIQSSNSSKSLTSTFFSLFLVIRTQTRT